jgi:hypothetical protein
MHRRVDGNSGMRVMQRLIPPATTILTCGLLMSSIGGRAQERSEYPVNNSHIVYHAVRTNKNGAILPWYSDNPSVAYDHNLRLIWSFWRRMRTCGDHIPYYLQHQVWKEKGDDPRGIGGDQIAMALDSWNVLYGYLGDEALHENMQMMANFWLDHGMSSPDLLYGNLPYPYDLEVCSGNFDGDMRAGKGYLQPDKAGSFGAELVLLYKVTGNRRYLDAAIKIANTLSATIKPGDADRSPWGFRVDAATGKPAQGMKNGVLVRSEYTSNWTPALRLFEQLIALHAGQTETYRRTSSLVKEWLKKYAIPAAKWGPFFEDIPTEDYSDTEINADTLAAYILEDPDWGVDRTAVARRILEWTEGRLGNHTFSALHVTPINEQTMYEVPGNSHTARHAWVRLLYCEKTGDCADRQQQVLRLNWATYSVADDGRNRYPNDDIWLTDGYGDYVRHYLRAMASMPELAPDNQNHLLRTSSAIQSISYSTASIRYRKFDTISEERFKLGAAMPLKVIGGTFTWNPALRVLDLHSNRRSVLIKMRPRTP